jgi:hypothetical protein
MESTLSVQKGVTNRIVCKREKLIDLTRHCSSRPARRWYWGQRRGSSRTVSSSAACRTSDPLRVAVKVLENKDFDVRE